VPLDPTSAPSGPAKTVGAGRATVSGSVVLGSGMATAYLTSGLGGSRCLARACVRVETLNTLKV
jgi:hypothetical protein